MLTPIRASRVTAISSARTIAVASFPASGIDFGCVRGTCGARPVGAEQSDWISWDRRRRDGWILLRVERELLINRLPCGVEAPTSWSSTRRSQGTTLFH
jgi:hypothetical protein